MLLAGAIVSAAFDDSEVPSSLEDAFEFQKGAVCSRDPTGRLLHSGSRVIDSNNRELVMTEVNICVEHVRFFSRCHSWERDGGR